MSSMARRPLEVLEKYTALSGQAGLAAGLVVRALAHYLVYHRLR